MEAIDLIRIFTSLYPELNRDRAGEIQECLKRNIGLSTIDGICLLLEGDSTPLIQSTKIKTRFASRRPNYSEFFDWANSEIESQDDITVVCNSDIHLDETIAELGTVLKVGQCAALTRWDEQPDGTIRLFDRNDSQDTWVFRGPIRSLRCDYPMGIPRCDNRLLHELISAGYDVINPAFSIKTIHLHAGERDEYPGEIEGPHVDPPYAYLWPHNLHSLPRTIWNRLRDPSRQVSWRFDRRKLSRSLLARVFNRCVGNWRIRRGPSS